MALTDSALAAFARKMPASRWWARFALAVEGWSLPRFAAVLLLPLLLALEAAALLLPLLSALGKPAVALAPRLALLAQQGGSVPHPLGAHAGAAAAVASQPLAGGGLASAAALAAQIPWFALALAKVPSESAEGAPMPASGSPCGSEASAADQADLAQGAPSPPSLGACLASRCSR
jgi:hypothetical protein